MRRRDELKVHGRHACRALFAARPDDIVQVYLTPDQVSRFGDLLKHCARARRPYRIVPPAELEALTESKHHEGICVVAHARPRADLAVVLRTPAPAYVVALAEVANPHNVGAILRVGAHFGARAALVAGERGQPLPRVTPAAYRIAQGGAEALDLVATDDLDAALEQCRRGGFTVCSTSSHAGHDLYTTALPDRVVVVLGAEATGVPASLLRRGDLALRIPGTGHVESLNVATAAAVILGELWRQLRSRTR